jgi:conjugal transfer pilus assembly protein TrbC
MLERMQNKIKQNKYNLSGQLMLLSFCLISQIAIAKPALYIFVSSSMPTSSLIDLSKAGKKANVSLELRGLVNDSFKDTATFINEIVKETSWGMSVNPDNFNRFEVSHVPCFVLADINRDGTIQSFDKVSGNVTLDYALEQIASHGELADTALELLAKLRGDDD